MVLNTMRFLSLLFAALALIPIAALLMGLPSKIDLPGEDYLTVQQIYRAWELGWLVVVIALVSTLVLTIMVRKKPKVFVLTLVALICIIGTLPANWSELRNQWEYS